MPKKNATNCDIRQLEVDARQLLSRMRPDLDPSQQTDTRTAVPGIGITRPFVIEFTGMPKAGKTTAFERLVMFLGRNGFRVAPIAEKAGVCSVPDKKHMFFNVWTACQTLSDLVAALQAQYDIIVIDRGIFDALTWMRWLKNKGRMSVSEYDIITDFLCLERWKSVVDLVFLLTITPEEALRREHSQYLTAKPGTIMNPDALNEFKHAIDQTIAKFTTIFRRIEHIHTTKSNPARSTASIVQRTLRQLTYLADEKVMVIPRSVFSQVKPQSALEIQQDKLQRLTALVQSNKKYVSRAIAESDFSLVQPIVVCVIRHDDQLFLVRKKESDKRNRMHDKYAIWVGGHVRETDDFSTQTSSVFENALTRELAEEVSLNVNGDVKPIGYAWDETSDKSQIHIALVYELPVADRDVKLALTQREFTERRGTSMSGSFQSIAEISRLGHELELWSHYILRDYYHVDSLRNLNIQRSLFTD